MTTTEVDDLSETIDLPALRGYWAAVGERTVEVIRSAGSVGWGATVAPEQIHRIVREEGGYGPNAEWTEPLYARQTRGWMVGHLALTHTYGHFFEARVVRGMLGFPGHARTPGTSRSGRRSIDAVLLPRCYRSGPMQGEPPRGHGLTIGQSSRALGAPGSSWSGSRSSKLFGG